ncbi:MAG: 2-phosphosulfolactate phosphatase [Methanobrevibacter sp.]|jgi:2-phosphosulfolactate phosphatase|nr:2-phosphosulfolactate phosphatase [Candidatus Methanoflexus mossambicus]
MKNIKITLSLEKTVSKDVSIMVDALRASTTITIALDKYRTIIPAFSKEEAEKIAIKNDAVLAGERTGKKINGFTLGNSPIAIKNYKTNKEVLVLTTSNGTRILKSMGSKVLIGALINSASVAKAALNLANSHIDVVMAGVRGKFAIEDYLVGGDIVNSIIDVSQEYNFNNQKIDLEIDEYAKIAKDKSKDYENLKNSILNSKSANRLMDLGYKKDILFSIQKNISKNIGIYENNEIRKYLI